MKKVKKNDVWSEVKKSPPKKEYWMTKEKKKLSKIKPIKK